MQSRTVMVIDDSEADLLFTQIMLERCGVDFDVLAFESARDALAQLERHWSSAGLILLDINMPQMSGWDFLDAYAALAQARPVHPTLLMLTSSPDPVDRERALANPLVQGYIEKPLGLAQAAALQRFFEGGDVPT